MVIGQFRRIQILTMLSLLCVLFGSAQQLQRLKILPVSSDTILLDSLSLLKGSIVQETFPENDSLYYAEIDYHLHALVFKNKKPDSIRISYKVFPYNFEKTVFHKNISNLYTDLSVPEKPFTIKYNQKTGNESLLKSDGLNKNGTISRGITVGNNQDAVLNSNLNLQVSGKLTPEIDLLMVATDNNIPFQADGTTAQLQEFDKVFVQLNNATTRMIVGDYQLQKPKNSYFMNFYKRAQGLYLDNVFTDSSNAKPVVFKTQVAGAVSRGKFSRQVFFGIENNQGPYRLRGADNEPFIIILSGTEKIYIDGKLLLRGQENDYIIDYNTGELTFTAKQQITKDKRIVAEFQYAERNYARSMFMFGEEIQGKKASAYLNFFSEQDNKNRSLQQSLSQEQKLLLAQVGDTIDKAFSSGAIEATFNSNDVFYRKKDTIVNSILYTSIYEYSTNPDSAKFLVKFSQVGNGNGNYVQTISAANGRVYKWVAPVNNIPQGNFEPIVPLVSPKQNQMLTAGFNYSFTERNIISTEGVYTKNDLNTLSKANKGNDEGSGLKIASKNFHVLKTDTNKQSSKLIYDFNYEYVQKNFRQIERFRSIEFDRDWNRNLNGVIINDQHISKMELGYIKENRLGASYMLNSFIEGNNYQGTKHQLLNFYTGKSFQARYLGSLLNSKDRVNSTQFYRHKIYASQKLGKAKVAFNDEFEDNKFKIDSTRSFSSRTYQFWEWEGSISNADSSLNNMKLFYKERIDKQAYNNEIKDSTKATNIGLQASIQSIRNNPFSVYVTYRQLDLKNTISNLLKPDNTFLNRLEYNPRWWKGFVTMGLFYETGYGLENRREFYYLEVVPGQGQYAWIDYNGDNIKQLNEFEIAQFSDQARYIRVFTPTNQYVKVLQNQLSVSANIRPSSLLRGSSKTTAKFFSRWVLQTAYRSDNKTQDRGDLLYFNPFLNLNDSVLIANTNNLRQSVFFNQSSAVFGGDYTYVNNASKQLLNGGIETRLLESHEIKFRLNFARWFTFSAAGLKGVKGQQSLLFSNRNFLIHTIETEPKLSYQPGTTFRISGIYKYSEKTNTYNQLGQKAVIHNGGLELKYNQSEKGSFNLRFDLVQINYNDTENSAVAYEMLNGLSNGTNYTWELLYQRNINNNLQISLNYNGRKTGSAQNIIHIGGGSIRAFF
jgi:hypothetical protein